MTESPQTRVSQNGYQYTRLGPGNWVLTHHLIAAKTLGRPVNTKVETIRFIDGNRENLDPINITVVSKTQKTTTLTLSRLKTREADLVRQLKAVRDEIATLESLSTNRQGLPESSHRLPED